MPVTRNPRDYRPHVMSIWLEGMVAAYVAKQPRRVSLDRLAPGGLRLASWGWKESAVPPRRVCPFAQSVEHQAKEINQMQETTRENVSLRLY